MFGNSKTQEEKKATAYRRAAKGSLLLLKMNGFNHGMKVDKKNLTIMDSGSKTVLPLKGARATVESEGELRKRITATRLLATGVFALALQKKESTVSVVITVENGDGIFSCYGGDHKNEQELREYADHINTVSAYLESGGEL